uniref:Uncharacterized protein n=1 Tax=Leishmania guyanensis TaxID=5670 RepID=A0A1E1J9K2_LEIGU|nr:Hypothetical protein BN36_NA76420 [Leishmania guyanensis]CCM43469.1 Hypothetical protein BN36_NA76760 [Leishmania guyanensis]
MSSLSLSLSLLGFVEVDRLASALEPDLCVLCEGAGACPILFSQQQNHLTVLSHVDAAKCAFHTPLSLTSHFSACAAPSPSPSSSHPSSP